MCRRWSTRLIPGLLMSLALMSGAEARELVYGSWLSPRHGLNRVALPILFEGVARDTQGAIEWKLVAGGQLADGRSTPKAVRDGLIDAGFGIAPYVANRLPATNMIFSTYVFGEDVVAATGATMETVLLHCPECLAEHREMNALPLAGYDSAPFLLMCRDVLSSLSELKGKKVRTAGGGVHLMTMAGATPVAMNPAEATTALQRGTVDCVHGSGSWIRSYGYGDVVRSVIDYPLGIAGPAMAFHVNRKTWQSLTPAQRRAHWTYLPAVVAHAVIDVHYEETEEVLAEVKAKGVSMVKGGPEFKMLVDQFGPTQRGRNIADAEAFGVKRAEPIMDAFERALKKWQALSPSISRDVAKFEAALRREVYDRVDFDSL